MAKVSSKRSPMPLSFLFANNRRVKSTKGHRLASWWYSTWINVIVTVPKSCYCKTLMKGPTDEIDGTRLKSWCKVCFCACLLNCFSCVRLFATLWTVAHQALLSMGFSRQEYWSGLPCSPPGDLSHPGIEPTCLMSPALSGGIFTTSTTREACLLLWLVPNKQTNKKLVTQSCLTLCNPVNQAPLSMGFSRQEYWSGRPLPSPGDLPKPGIKLWSVSLQMDSLPSEPPGKSS